MSPAVGFRDATAIAGIAQTEFAKHLEPTEAELACQVIVDACADAGIDPSEIDALCSYTMEATEEVEIARNIGCGDITFFSQVGYGGGAGCGVVGHAAMAVATGQAEVAVAWRSPQARLGPPALDATPRSSCRCPGSLDPALRACSGRWTRSPCSPAATCTSTGPPASTWQRAPSPCGATPTEPRRLHVRRSR